MVDKQSSKEKSRRLIQEVISAQHDPVSLGESLGMSPEELAGWVEEQEHQRVLNGLCLLADYQTRLLLCRYRRLAAGRLVRLATEESSDEKSRDVARRACVDLLKMDLKPAEPAAVSKAMPADSDEANKVQPESLRQLLYKAVGEIRDTPETDSSEERALGEEDEFWL